MGLCRKIELPFEFFKTEDAHIDRERCNTNQRVKALGKLFMIFRWCVGGDRA